MLLTTNVDVTVNSKTLKYFIDKGYQDIKVKDKLNISISDLQKKSHIKVKVICDNCGKEKDISYYTYKDPYYCNSCSFIRGKITKKEKYGDENYVNVKQMIDTKKIIYGNSNNTEKIKNTIKQKYGVNNIFELDNVKEKIKKTKKEKYGNENYNNRDKMKRTKKDRYGDENYNNMEKNIKTCFEKYGMYSSSTDLVKSKKNITFQKKYNGILMGSDIISEKIKKTNINKYGSENPFKNSIIKNKIKNTNLNRYGSENYFSSDNFKNFIKNNLLEKYKDYNIIDIDENQNYILKCDQNKEHNYKISHRILYNRIKTKTILCTECNPIYSTYTSGHENMIYNFIKDNYKGIIINNDRNVIKPSEIDIYLPELRIGIEFNGLYWHNELFVDDNYHFNKTELCEKNNIKLIQIYEDDWLYKQDIVKSRILNLLNNIPNKIYARKCKIKEIKDNKLVKEFLEDNHIQGFIGSSVKIGLFYNNELVSLMIFGKKRMSVGKGISNENEYELLRFCSKLNTNIIGGANKLFSYFINNYKFKEIISYADRSWSHGNLYEKLGFKFIHKTEPNYYYVIGNIRYHRFSYRKDKLIKEGFDPSKTEHEIMLERNIHRIYDSGSMKYSYNKKN